MAMTVLVGSVALAQTPPVEPALYEEGRIQFDFLCVHCHQPDGTGRAPIFPALAGNDRLGDLSLIVGNVHNGKGMMPAFPSLAPDTIAALATYVRNSWGNAFGGVTAIEVEAVLSQHPAVASVAVVPRADPVMGEIGVAVVVPAEGADAPSLSELRAFGSDDLAAYKLPEDVQPVDALPLTAGDKVDRRALADTIRDAPTDAGADRHPETTGS